MRTLLDTNILIDYLGGVEAAREEIGRLDAPLISSITWMEVLVGASDEGEMARLRWFLSGFGRVAIDDRVSELAVAIRREHRIRLPDAIIWASARSIGGLLVTRNTRDFPADAPDIRVPYSISARGGHPDRGS
ncbi:MAG: type II toxin-antitoxin system VapC family toxin [Acidobacteria bacterium]|nr:type II toxin-antitoxin system VapC family toxin [Acidobacteriota bacterium]